MTIGIPIVQDGITRAVLLLGYRNPLALNVADMTAVYAALPGLETLLEEEGHKDE